MFKEILFIVTFVIGIINAQGGQDVLTPLKAYRRTPYVLDAATSNNPSMKYFRYAFNNDIAQAGFHPLLLRFIANLFDKRTSLFPLTTQYSPSWAFDNKIKELGGTRNVSYKNMIRSVSSGTLSLRQLCEIVLYYHKSLIVLEVPTAPQTPAPAPAPQNLPQAQNVSAAPPPSVSAPQSAQAPATAPPPQSIASAPQAPMPQLLSDTTSNPPPASTSQVSPFFQMIANQLMGSPPSAPQPASNSLDIFFK